jgi:hypothetical protein
MGRVVFEIKQRSENLLFLGTSAKRIEELRERQDGFQSQTGPRAASRDVLVGSRPITNYG